MRVPVALVARTLALSWAGFWTFFFVAESAAWHTPVSVAMLWLGLGLLFVVISLAAWHWEITGGLLLMAVGLGAAIAYVIWTPPNVPFISRVFTTVVGSVPPVVAGILFLMHHRTMTAHG